MNSTDIQFSLTDFTTWRQNTLPLSPWNADYHWVPIMSNPYGLVQYRGSEVFQRMLIFPVAASLNGEQVAWALTYNVSDTSVRIRGLYVLPEFRGRGLGPALCDYALSLWPEPWDRCVGYWRSDTFTVMQKHWQLERAAGHGWRTRIVSPEHTRNDYQIILGARPCLRTQRKMIALRP